ncbi:MAG: PilN domain-containing protein [Verrucomicrobiae bacterium]|nr:PilN domain-containing protein [Verrucomicrobiae bacterium]
MSKPTTLLVVSPQSSGGWSYARARTADNQRHVEGPESASSVTELRAVGDHNAKVRLVISATETLALVQELPATDPGELRQMISLQLDQWTPLPPEDVVFDFAILGAVENKTRILLVMAPRAVVNDQVTPLEEAGLPAEHVTVDALVRWSLLRRTQRLPVDDSLHLWAHAEPDKVDLVAWQNGQPVVVRSLPGPLEANELATELQRTALAAQTVVPTARPGTLWLSGSVSTDVASAWRGAVLTLPPEIVPAAVVCGVDADDGIAAINLLPAEWLQQRRARARRRRWMQMSLAAAAVYAVALLGLGIATAIRHHQVQQLHAEKQRLMPEYQAARQLNNELQAIQAQLDDRRSALEVLREVALVLPDNLKLNSFSYRREEGVTLKGQALDAPSVYTLIDRLQRSGLFREVKTGGGGLRTEPGTGLTRFEVTATLASAASKPRGASWR